MLLPSRSPVPTGALLLIKVTTAGSIQLPSLALLRFALALILQRAISLVRAAQRRSRARPGSRLPLPVPLSLDIVYRRLHSVAFVCLALADVSTDSTLLPTPLRASPLFTRLCSTPSFTSREALAPACVHERPPWWVLPAQLSVHHDVRNGRHGFRLLCNSFSPS